MYKHLFSPITINKLEIKNRIAYPSLGLMYSHDGKLNDRYIQFYRERARGGAGIVTVGPVGVDFLGIGALGLSIARDEDIPDFAHLASVIKNEGARSWVQLFHAGAYSIPLLINGEQPLAPSAVYSNYSRTTPREMTIDDIKNTQENFARAALRVKEAGFDGVEVIGSAGYLLTQFLSPLKNQRTDEYGGSFENRCRFAKELFLGVRKAVGPDYPMTVRMAGNDFVPGSNTDTETPKIARMYADCGVDAINVTGGWHESRIPQLPMETPRSVYAFLALNIKKEVSVPVMASNRITTPEIAEQVIRDGYADMVNLGRVLIGDPEWPIKAFEGRADEIRPCVACNQGCTDQIFSAQPVFCIGNPQAGFEGERQLVKTKTPKKVMVIGAGAAGLEAAVTAHKIGHQVTLFEKDDDIGGQLWIAGAPPHKQELLGYIRYYRAMLKKYEIPLRLKTEVTPELITAEKPDAIILAEGATALIPPIDGIDDSSVISAWDVLRNSPLLGKEVAVIGGGAVGLETALFVAHKGTLTPEILHFLFTYEAQTPERLRELMFNGTSRVTVFEMLPKAGKDVGKSTKWVLMGNLERFNVRVMTNTRVTGIANGNVTYVSDNGTRTAKFDNIIIASGSRPETKMTQSIAGMGIPYKTVGDCTQVGKLNDAIHGGFLAALELH